MRDMIIKFKNPDEVRAFVNKVEKYPYEMQSPYWAL